MTHALEVTSTEPLHDMLRVFLIFVPASIIVGYVTLVLIVYLRAYRAERFRSARAGLLPHHVWMISISYLLLIIDQVIVVYGRKNTGFDIHAMLLIPAFVTGIIAMKTVFSYEQIRHRAAMETANELDGFDDLS